MNKRLSAISILSFTVIGIGLLFQPTVAETLNRIQVKGVTLRGSKATILHKGSKPVRVKDKLRVDKKLIARKAIDARGNILMKDGKTVDGVDISALASTVDTLSADEGVALPTDCTEGQVAKYSSEGWVCADDTDTDTDTDTTYTAGTGITISGGVISSTITDTDTTYSAGTGITITDGVIATTIVDTDTDTTYSAGTGISIDGTTINSTVTDTDTTYTAGAGLALSGTTFSLEGTSYDNVIIVAKSGGDYTTITEAMESIDDSSSSNEYYVWVAPGIYVEEVEIPDYVTLEGAGPERVLIGSTATTDTVGAITAGRASEIRNLSVAGYGTTYSTSIYIPSDADATIENVHMNVGDPTGTAYGLYNAGGAVLHNVDFTIGDAPTAGYTIFSTTDLEIYDSQIAVNDAYTSYAVFVYNAISSSTVKIRNSELIVSGDDSTTSTICNAYYQSGSLIETTIYSSLLDATKTDEAEGCSSSNVGAVVASGTVEVYDSQIKGDGFGVFQANNTMTIVNSQVAGSNEHSGNTITCVGAYDEDFASLNTTCS